MDPLEVYKRLPRIDCGECPEGKCLAFALKLSKGQRDVSECLKITEPAKRELIILLADEKKREDSPENQGR
jgi:ArsR family metal-binding transcriptional regulator